MLFLCVKLLAKTFFMEFSPQLGYAGFNLQVQVKLEFVVTSARTQGCYSETVSVGKNASFKLTENVCGRKNLQIIRSYHAILSFDNEIFHSNIVVL